MDNVIAFPSQVRVQAFEEQEATKAKLRQVMGAIIGTYHTEPTFEEQLRCFQLMGDAFELMSQFYINKALLEAQR